MNKTLANLDHQIIYFLRKINVTLARFALFLVYFWFGILKLFNVSPANPLVEQLQQKTLPFITFDQFIIFFALLEMTIGILFLIPKLERVAIGLLVLHLITTIMPMFLLPEIAWSGFLTPTLEGQYMIKNIVIIALAISIGTTLTSWKEKKTKD